MTKVIGVRFRNVGKIYYFDPVDFEIKSTDRVIVETARGIECGFVSGGVRDVPDEEIVKPLKAVIRIATPEDVAKYESNRSKEHEAFKICKKKISEHELEMKLVDVEYTFDGQKILFYFTADGRVDFRELVKDLAGVFRTRIELRQIGVRDESKLLGGIGICGKPFCCSQFLFDFQPVSIKMAKEQGKSLNPAKISGTCGRLMCCLKYEQNVYDELLKETPKNGSLVETADGRGVVVESALLARTVKVRLLEKNDGAPKSYKISDLTVLTNGRPQQNQTPKKDATDAADDAQPGQAQKKNDNRTVNKPRRKNNERKPGDRQTEETAKFAQPKQQPAKRQPVAKETAALPPMQVFTRINLNDPAPAPAAPAESAKPADGEQQSAAKKTHRGRRRPRKRGPKPDGGTPPGAGNTPGASE